MSVLAICSWLLRTTDHSGRLVGLGGGVSWGTFAGLLCTICSYGALPAGLLLSNLEKVAPAVVTR